MHPDYLIVEATAADAKTISSLAHRIWPATYHFLPEGQVAYMLEAMYSGDALLKQMHEQQQQFILLLHRQQPVGFASYTAHPETKTAKLNKLYLLPELHGQGLGKLLLAEVEKQTQARGCNFLTLNVNRHNPAFGFYSSAGFEIVQEADIPIGPYFMNDYVLEKKLFNRL